MSKFKVGDRVRVVHEYPGGILSGFYDGETGVLISIRPAPRDSFPYMVRFHDKYICSVAEIELIQQPVIVITTDGKTTTATKRLGKQVLCTASAVCSEDDTFDFNTGAELAFQRLREKEMPVPKYYSGKVVCVESRAPWWTVGRVYTVENGCIIDDAGDPNGCQFKSIDSLNAWAPLVRRFIPLVED